MGLEKVAVFGRFIRNVCNGFVRLYPEATKQSGPRPLIHNHTFKAKTVLRGQMCETVRSAITFS
jgi:hypothetical protein